MHKKRYFL